MPVLSQDQIDAFWRDGYLVVPDAVTPAQLAALRGEIAGWVEASRAHSAPFGPPACAPRPFRAEGRSKEKTLLLLLRDLGHFSSQPLMQNE